VLGGHCNGALVAFETARLLVQAGRRVDLVVMVDPVTVSLWPLVRPFLLALGSAQRVAGLAADQDHSLALAWSRLRKLEVEFRTGRFTRRWKKSWDNQWKVIGSQLGLKRRQDRSARLKATTSPGTTAAKRDRAKLNTPLKQERMRAYARVMSNYYPTRLE